MATVTAARVAATAMSVRTDGPAPHGRVVGPSRTVRARPRRALAEERDVSPSASRPGDRPRTLGWGRKRGAVGPDEALLEDPDTHGYCVYSHADWSYAYKSVAGEFDSVRDGGNVEGTIPAELIGGVLYRNGPGLFERGGREYNHMLDGDGYVLRFEFVDARTARFASKFVRTEEFAAEESADDVLYRGTFGTMRTGGPLRNALDLHQKNLANTNILAWGGKVYALYEAGRPVELDPETLETIGEDDLDGRVNKGMFVSVGAGEKVESALGIGGKAFTAHPHVDPNTGRVVAWGWTSAVAARSVEATFWEWEGRLARGRFDGVLDVRVRSRAARLRRDQLVVRHGPELPQGGPADVPRGGEGRGRVPGFAAGGSRDGASDPAPRRGLRRRRGSIREDGCARGGAQGVLRDPRGVRARWPAHLRGGRVDWRRRDERVGHFLHGGVVSFLFISVLYGQLVD